MHRYSRDSRCELWLNATIDSGIGRLTTIQSPFIFFLDVINAPHKIFITFRIRIPSIHIAYREGGGGGGSQGIRGTVSNKSAPNDMVIVINLMQKNTSIDYIARTISE
jgi:hypothetical protein